MTTPAHSAKPETAPRAKRREVQHVEPLSGADGARCLFGGGLMGLANLVPGISGGTMLLAAGVYPRFIQSISSLSSLRFDKHAIASLALVVGAAVVAILLGAGTVRDAVLDHRWVMYSLFIGLTLGGVPLLWQMAKPAKRAFGIASALGLVVMVALAWLQLSDGTGGQARTGAAIMFAAGVAGASAMILPGVSGGYLLLLLGVYVPVLDAIDTLKTAVKTSAWSSATGAFTEVVLPVGIGVVVGVVVVSNLVAFVMKRYEQATLGALMGLLVGAVAGLWPFRQGVAPKVGEVFKGRPLTPETLAELSPSQYPTEFFAPSAPQLAGALALVVLGYFITRLVTHLGTRLGR